MFIHVPHTYIHTYIHAQYLVFEDALNGIQAARAAGMQCIYVPDPNMYTTKELCGADQVLHSLNEFKPQDWGFPPY